MYYKYRYLIRGKGEWNTPVAKIVEPAWKRCNVPSSIFNAITPWQVPKYRIKEIKHSTHPKNYNESNDKDNNKKNQLKTQVDCKEKRERKSLAKDKRGDGIKEHIS